MLRREWEVKVAYNGDDVTLTHPNDDGTLTYAERDSEDFTATDAVRDLIRNLYDAEVEFVFSGDIPGGTLYTVAEAPPED